MRGQWDDRDCGGGDHLVDLEGHAVGFESFFVVVFALLDEGPDVPAYVRLEVFAHAVLDQCDASLALAEVDHDEALHAHGFCSELDGDDWMRSGRTAMLWIFLEDLVCDFATL